MQKLLSSCNNYDISGNNSQGTASLYHSMMFLFSVSAMVACCLSVRSFANCKKQVAKSKLQKVNNSDVEVLPHKTVYGVTVLVDKLRVPSCIVMIFTST